MRPSDPRRLACSDTDNPDGPKHAYFRSLAGEIHAPVIVDLACGTGIVTATLGGDDRRVIGIDPPYGMLGSARGRRVSRRITWIPGDSRGPLTQCTEFTAMNSSNNASYTAHYIFRWTGKRLRYSRSWHFATRRPLPTI